MNPDRPKSSAPQGKLSLKEKWSYGLGDVSHGLAASATGLFIMLYLTDVAGLKPFHAGLAIMIGRIWDSVTDPVMGWITDKTKTRWGSRRPYLLFGAVPYGIAFFSLWVIPEFGGDKILVFAYITIALLFFNTFLTIVFVPYTSLTASLTNDYDERTSLTGYRMASSQIAFLIGAAFPSILDGWIASESGMAMIEPLGRASLFGSWAGTPRETYLIMGAIFGLIMIASILICFWGTQEKKQIQPETPANPEEDSTPLNYAASILEELQGNRPFRSAVLILLVTNCATTLVAANLAYYFKYILDMKAQQTSIFLTLFSAAILAMPLWVILSKKYGKSEVYTIAMAIYPVVLCSLFFLGPDSGRVIYIISAIAGIFHAAALMIPWAIIPDVVEYDQLKTGKRREGLFYGGTTFSYKMASGLAIFISGIVLSLVGFEANVEQSNVVKNGLKFLIGPGAGALLLLGAYMGSKYPLTRETHKKILKELKEKGL